ncbi:sulfotransferase 1E1-like [Glandiceps talaboti]
MNTLEASPYCSNFTPEYVHDTSLLDAVKDFEVRPDDIFIVSYPQSGTTAVEHILRQLYGNWGTLKVTDHGLVPVLESRSSQVKHGFTECMSAPSPRLIRSHLPYLLFPRQQATGKTIVIIRNPKDLCLALYNNLITEHGSNPDFPDELRSWSNFVERFATGHVPCGPWLDHVIGWLESGTPNCLFMKYEDLRSDPRTAIINMCQFIGLGVHTRLVDSVVTDYEMLNMIDLDESLSFNAKDRRQDISLRKSFDGVGSWKSYFSVAQSDRLDTFVPVMQGKGFGEFV